MISETVPQTSMTHDSASSRRALEPVDRISEVLFGLIMVLTFTGALSVAEAGRADVRGMLIGALGCNLAWGVIDALFYLMGCLAERGRNLQTLIAVRRASDAEQARRLIADVLPPMVASALEPSAYAALHQRLKGLPEPRRPARLHRQDWLGAAGVFLLVFLSTFPVVLPFLFMQDITPALHLSNAIAVSMLAASGFTFGRITGRHPWMIGIGMVIVGALVVAFTIALGG
jgi:hypothetical protein